MPTKPFIAINCAAIPETLLETELFGHEKGAFTGAIGTKKGKLEVAEGGTVFLDEIGELAPALQAKLLRVLQQREFERVGGTRVLKFNARVIAATNRNLEEAIKSGQFRQDLYYRLNVVSTVVPPLRDRPDDIPLLAMYFAAKYAQKCKRSFKGMSSEARLLLMNYAWPGNVRELENAIEHAMVLGLSDEIVVEDLPEALLETQSAQRDSAKYHDRLNQLKKQMIHGCRGAEERQLHRSRQIAGSSSQLPAPPHPQPGSQAGAETGKRGGACRGRRIRNSGFQENSLSIHPPHRQETHADDCQRIQ